MLVVRWLLAGLGMVAGDLCEERPDLCCYSQPCSQLGTGAHLPPSQAECGGSCCTGWGSGGGGQCCTEWCQCFMDYSFTRDCGQPRVWSAELSRCAQPWEVEECGVVTTTTTPVLPTVLCQVHHHLTLPLPLSRVFTTQGAAHNNCAEDGYYPEGACEPEFCQCWQVRESAISLQRTHEAAGLGLEDVLHGSA